MDSSPDRSSTAVLPARTRRRTKSLWRRFFFARSDRGLILSGMSVLVIILILLLSN